MTTRRRAAGKRVKTKVGRSYILNGIPDEVHAKALAVAKREGRSLRWVLVNALADYGERRYRPRNTVRTSWGYR